MKQRDLIKKLTNAGYRLDRKGKHKIYEKEGYPPVQVPDHREINENTARAILKAAGLK
jgi:mRNA interferase HicA